MSDRHSVSRRTSLKQLGVVGAAAVIGGAARMQAPGEPRPRIDLEPRPASLVDVAVGRMAKGHS